MKLCSNCVNGLMWDTGYSNWTVEGTDFHCIISKHPEAPFDKWYGKDKRLEHAEKCPDFFEGEAQGLDVDMEDLYELSPEAQAYVRG